VGTIAKTVAMHNLAEESTKHLKAFTITKQGHFPVTARLYVSSASQWMVSLMKALRLLLHRLPTGTQ